MPAFQEQQAPVALSGQVLRLEPEGELRRVRALEPLAQIGPVDFGSVTAGSNATDSSGSTEIEVTELEMNQNQIGQFYVRPVSPVEIEIRQTGQQDQRMTIANSVSQITPTTPAHFAELYVLTDGVPYFRVSNPNQFALGAARVSFYGYKYLLESGEVSDPGGQPISVPTDKLEQSVQAGGGGARQPSRRGGRL